MKINQKTCTPETVLSNLGQLGLALKLRRLKMRLTHEEAALTCNFSRQTLSRIERGDPSVAIGQVARYAECVGATKAFQLKSATLAITAMKRVRRTALEVKATRLSAARQATPSPAIA
jgi:transcriptional regulator with XRE-family HTH domain